MPNEPHAVKHCIIIPFYNRLSQVRQCVSALLSQAFPNTVIVLVNDGTAVDEVAEHMVVELADQHLVLLQHQCNQGVAAARNTAINWARQNNIDIVLMIDSDCLPGPNFIQRHLELHQDFPDVACFGGGVVGVGKSLWAKLDKVMSWVHSVPYGNMREIKAPYHLPTTNFSVKVSLLPDGYEVFDERLCTGEDALLIRRFRNAGKKVMFSPSPVIHHYDRERLKDVFQHHYKWGHHQYFIQLNNDISPRSFNPLYRFVFLIVFIPCMPMFACLGAFLNLKPWLAYRPTYIALFPVVFLVWLGKAVAVAEAALAPHQCLRSTSERIP